MELVEGETLRDRIDQGALPIPEALGIAAQVASALEAAHEQGIVHRDLKPANVKLRPDGTVKLLDFGLAKVLDPTARASAPTEVTLTALGLPGAYTGQILGSPSCMSPEQARGLPVDKRTDVWAFGCLLYEMLCGTRAFGGERTSEVIAKIFEREPDYAALPPALPAEIPRLLRRCLEKDRRRRLRDMGDARIELLDVLDHTAAGPTATGPLAARASMFRKTPVQRRLLAAAALTVLAGMGIWLALRARTVLPSAPVARFSIPEPSVGGAGIAISADGTRVAYVTRRGLVVRALDRLEGTVAVSLNNSQANPFFSPDGQWLGFKGWEALRKVPVAGGAATTLVDRIFPAGAWGGEDIIFGETRGLFRVPAAGGKVVKLLATREVEQIVSVEMIPDRQAVLFTVIPTRGNVPGWAASMPSARIEALDLRTGNSHVVLRGGGRPRYTQTGHLLYSSGGTLYAIGFDKQRLQTRGDAVPVIVTGALIDFDVSENGTLLYQIAQPEPPRQLVWVDRQADIAGRHPRRTRCEREWCRAERLALGSAARDARAVHERSGPQSDDDLEPGRAPTGLRQRAIGRVEPLPSGRRRQRRAGTPVRQRVAADADQLYARRTVAGVRWRVRPTARHLRDDAGRQSRDETADPGSGQRTHGRGFAQRSLGRLRFRRIRPVRDLCTGVSRCRRQQSVAGFFGRWPAARVVARWP